MSRVPGFQRRLFRAVAALSLAAVFFAPADAQARGGRARMGPGDAGSVPAAPI